MHYAFPFHLQKVWFFIKSIIHAIIGIFLLTNKYKALQSNCAVDTPKTKLIYRPMSNIRQQYQGDGDPNEYLFFDLIHLTTAAHKLIANYSYSAIPEPAIVELPGFGLFGLVGVIT